MSIRTAFTDLVAIEHPIVGFNRSPAVVAHVTNADDIATAAPAWLRSPECLRHRASQSERFE